MKQKVQTLQDFGEVLHEVRSTTKSQTPTPSVASSTKPSTICSTLHSPSPGHKKNRRRKE